MCRFDLLWPQRVCRCLICKPQNPIVFTYRLAVELKPIRLKHKTSTWYDVITLDSSTSPPPSGEGMTAASKESAVDSEGGMSSIIYSTVKRVAVVGVIYFVGYMDWSVAWLITPLIFSVMRDQWKKKSDLARSIAIASAQANEKDVILAKISDLPSWVYFPDVERCEWVNRVS